MEAFDYYEPKTLKKATQLLAKHGEKAKILAGGINFIPSMRKSDFKAGCVVNIQKIAGLDRIKFDSGTGLRFGAMVTLQALERSPAVRKYYPAFYEALHQITSVQAKCMGTAVGNLCVGTPGSDVATVLFAFGARLSISGQVRDRVEGIEQFYTDKWRTSLQPGEMVADVFVPLPEKGTASAFLNLVRVHADVSKLTTAVTLTLDSGICKQARIALGAAAPTVFRATKAEEALVGRELTTETVKAAAQIAAGETRPSSGLRSTAEYRKEVTAVLVRRVIEKALTAAKVGNEEKKQ